MSKKHYAKNYMIYGCSDCKQGFKMYLEGNLETGGKPVPFSIQCPFCKGFSCYDVSGVIKLDKVYEIGKKVPYFADVPESDCGKPTNTEFAKVQFKKKEE